MIEIMIDSLFAILIITAFSLLPGLWVAYTLPLHHLRWYGRLALSVALSPAILATQVLLLKVLHVPFVNIPTIVLIINLPALIFGLRAQQTHREIKQIRPMTTSNTSTWPTIFAGGATFALLLGYLAIPWRLIQDLRPFAWHALWHTDVTYALTRNTLLPEEPELAGMRLAYGWFPHLFWSVTGWATDLPPTMLYAITNVIWLAVAVVLGYALCRDGLQLPRPLAWLGTGTIFLGTNAVGAAAWLYARDWHWQKAYLGELRYTPMLSKYLGFETMPFAFALLLALVFIATLALRRHTPRLAIVLTILLSALGLIYPILFPAGCLVVGMLWLLLVFGPGKQGEAPSYTWRELCWIVIGGAVSLVITFGFLQVVMLDGANAPVRLSTLPAMQMKGIQVIVALLLFAPGLLYLARLLRQRAAPGWLLMGSTLLLMALYVVADLEALEYKFVLAATMVAAPLGAAGLAQLFRSTTLRWITTFGLLVGLMGINQLLMLRVGAQVPANLVNAPRIDEQSFWLRLQPEQTEAGWVAAVNHDSAPETIVVTQASRIHVSPFLNRSLYAPSDADGTAVAGYSVENRYNLLSWRGYSSANYDARLATVAQLYGDDEAQWSAALQKMLTLQRPLAIHLQAGSALEQRLQAQQLGIQLYRPLDTAADGGSVWLIEPSATTLRTLESLQEHAHN